MRKRIVELRDTGLPADPDSVIVSMWDVDSFKRINDTWGHTAGDEVVQSFAARLRHGLLESDIVSRIAGDEF